MSTEPVSQAEIEAIRIEVEDDDRYEGLGRLLLQRRTLLRAIAERDARLPVNQPVSGQLVSYIRDARVAGCYINHAIAEADIGILLQVIADSDDTIKRYEDGELVAIGPTVEICQLREQLSTVTAERNAYA